MIRRTDQGTKELLRPPSRLRIVLGDLEDVIVRLNEAFAAFIHALDRLLAAIHHATDGLPHVFRVTEFVREQILTHTRRWIPSH